MEIKNNNKISRKNSGFDGDYRGQLGNYDHVTIINEAETLYSIGNCPFCRDGDVIIVKDTRTDIYFVVCDECQRVWNNPGEAIACAPSIDFINELRYLSWTVTEEELDESGWRANVTHYL